MNFLPKELINLIYSFYDPIKAYQIHSMRQICITFDEANRKSRFDIISSYSRRCWYGLSSPEDEFEYPKVSKILKDIAFYKIHKKAIINMLKANDVF
jgi:hypothetical protein